jgi:tetratricopeptide (TPR) repeat protein
MKRIAAIAVPVLAFVFMFSYAFAETPVPAKDAAGALKFYAGASEGAKGACERAESLAAAGKWKSAFKVVDDFDKDSADPYVLAMKTSIVLRGAVRSDMHSSFGLVDLEAGQDVETLRNTDGDYETQLLDPPALAAAQAAKGVEAPGILSKLLGDYYYDVLGHFAGKWTISDDEILAKMAENYGRAYAAGVYDGESLVNQAESLVRLNRGDESEAIYRKAMELEPDNAAIRYGYASSLVYRDKKAEALPEIDKAILAYGDSTDRVNAIALGARVAAQLGDDARMESYFALADKGFPDSPSSGLLRHLVLLEVGKKDAAAAVADSVVAGYGSNPNVVRALVSAWYSSGDIASARSFLERNVAKGGDDMTIGTLDFYLAVLLTQESPSDADKVVALKSLDDAESHLKASLGGDSSVYGVIADMRSALRASPARDAAPAGGGSAAGAEGAASGPAADSGEGK